MLPRIPKSWRPHLEGETQKPYFKELETFLEAERKAFKIYPAEEDTFQALELTPYER
jgi:uracil-DNA glycosylase